MNKYIICLLFANTVTFSCDDRVKSESRHTTTINTSSKNLEEANRLSSLIYYHIEQVETGRMTPDQFDIVVPGIKDQLDSIVLLLTDDELDMHDSLSRIMGERMVDIIEKHQQQGD